MEDVCLQYYTHYIISNGRGSFVSFLLLCHYCLLLFFGNRIMLVCYNLVHFDLTLFSMRFFLVCIVTFNALFAFEWQPHNDVALPFWDRLCVHFIKWAQHFTILSNALHSIQTRNRLHILEVWCVWMCI